MRITIIGAGAIGGLAGAYMTEAGHDVTLVDRWAEHVEALRTRGLSIDGVRGPKHVAVRACTPDELEGRLECVLIATKSQHTEDAVRLVAPLLAPDGFVVSYQNGFNEPRIAEVLQGAGVGGAERVVGSIPNYGGALVDPGFVEFVHEGPIQLGEYLRPVTPRVRALAGMLQALTEVQLSDNIWGQVWAKEVYSAQVVFSALANAPVRDTLGVERFARIAGAVVREALEIAEANGIEVEAFDFFDPANYKPATPADTDKLLANIQHAIWLLKKDQDTKPDYDFKKKGSGIWWDIVYRRRASEVRASNGKLVELGRAAGADVRLNERMCEMIYEIEAGQRELGLHNYDELGAFVREIGKELP